MKTSLVFIANNQPAVISFDLSFPDAVFSSDSFEQEQLTLEVFIDLSKAFHTVDHFILLKKLRL